MPRRQSLISNKYILFTTLWNLSVLKFKEGSKMVMIGKHKGNKIGLIYISFEDSRETMK